MTTESYSVLEQYVMFLLSKMFAIKEKKNCTYILQNQNRIHFHGKSDHFIQFLSK